MPRNDLRPEPGATVIVNLFTNIIGSVKLVGADGTAPQDAPARKRDAKQSYRPGGWLSALAAFASAVLQKAGKVLISGRYVI